MSRRSGWDLLAAIAAVIALVMIGLYLGLIKQQGGQVAVWFLVGLMVGALLSLYSVPRRAPQRKLALAVSGGLMVVLGLLGILSIGLPILVAGGLALLAAARATSTG
jgi:hypothetical protein